MTVCCFIISNSAGVNADGLSKSASGMPILPMSCR